MISICSLWSSENIQWSKANWTFSECEMVQEICQVWSTTQFPWNMADWKWSECSSSVVPPIPVVTIGNQPGVDATTLIQPWLEEPWNPYTANDEHDRKRKRLIKLICKVHGKEYIEEREAKDFPVTIRDIRTVVKAVANIDLDFRLDNDKSK